MAAPLKCNKLQPSVKMGRLENIFNCVLSFTKDLIVDIGAGHYATGAKRPGIAVGGE